jgi:predicted nucleotidyltransferase
MDNLTALKKLVLDHLKDEKAKVVLFGSRARKDNRPFSDVDIGVIPYGEFHEIKITLLRDELENFNVPYRVEIVNFSEVSEDFKKEAFKDSIVWKD